MKNKILFICNDSNTVINFRKELILFLKDREYEIFVLAGDNKRETDIKKLGVNFSFISFSNREKSVLSSIKLTKKFKNAIKKINPNIVFTFQIKPNIFGAMAAKKAKIENIYSMIEGLGDPFQPVNFKGRILRKLISILYRKGLKATKKVFILNPDDKRELIKRRIVSENKVVLISGIGIDTKQYVPKYKFTSEKVVVNLSRLIVNKGIIEYCKIAREVRKIRPDILFKLYGTEDQLTEKDIFEYIKDNSIKYCGYSNNAAEIISNSSFVVSTSYREGFSRVLLEAMALGKPVIASNVVGNKEIVEQNKTGYLLDLNDLNTFVKCILDNIDNEELLVKMGKNARQICEDKYDSSIINKQIVEVIEINS